MPDLRSRPRTRYGGIQTSSRRKSGTINAGFRLEFIPMKIGAGVTILIEGVIYKQTLIS